MPLRERFESFFTKPSDPNGCWEWQGSRHKKGYGEFRVAKKMIKAHRVSYEIYCGEIPKDKMVLHSCDNPPCVNPNHLSVGTNTENIGESWLRGGHKRRLKLKPEDYDEIRNSSMSAADLARKFGIHRFYVAKIRNGTRGVRRSEAAALAKGEN